MDIRSAERCDAENTDERTQLAPPPFAFRSPHLKPVSIRARQPAAQRQREVSLYYAENGQRRHRLLTVGRPTVFEDVVVAVVDEDADLPARSLEWPRTALDCARFAFHRFREARASLGKPLRDPLPMYDVRTQEPNNFAHLLLEILPLYLFARDALDGNLRCVFREVHGPFRQLLDVLEIDAMFTARRLTGDMARVRGTRGLAAYDLLGVFDCPSITMLPHVYDRFAFATSKRVDKMFLARRGARALLNHAEVERILAAHGYETIYMEDHAVREQLALAAQAKHVVAVHGAAISTLVMNRGFKSMIELLPPHVYHQYFPICLDQRVERYMLLMPEFDEAVHHSGWSALQSYKDAPFAVDLVALERALEEAAA